MYPPSVDMKQKPIDHVKREYHKVLLTHGWTTRKFNKTTNGHLRVKIPLNIYHDTMVTWKQYITVGQN
jgi:hypothetical protein